jgi:phosphotransferase system  glucose/maltose/N-acetylglucosamine-specific IIC component
MEGKIWGIMLSILGIAGLIWAIIYINGPDANEHLPMVLAAGVFGALAFFTGIWLIDHKTVRRHGRKTGLMHIAKPKLQQPSA